ncbi:hypothetical protein VCRA2123O13_460003 [Vibrio crassostreae]|nr:hypothetical protein VCRA2123O13_460003 [Vibrio crassostreae]
MKDGFYFHFLKSEDKRNYHGRLAQLGEHLPYKQGVTGSSPVSPTIFKHSPRRVFKNGFESLKLEKTLAL